MGDGSTTFNIPTANDGRFLEGKTAAGGYTAAGLPNITGYLAATGANCELMVADPGAGGALETQYEYVTTFAAIHSSNASYQITGFTFDASRSSALYGANVTVQPKSVGVLFIIKY